MTGVATLADDCWTTVVDVRRQEADRGMTETAIFCGTRVRMICASTNCNGAVMTTLADTLNTAVIKAAIGLQLQERCCVMAITALLGSRDMVF